MPTSWRSRALLALAVLAAVVGAVLVVRALTASDPAPAPSPTPTATASPTEAAQPQPEPFSVKVKRRRGQPVDNQLLFGRKPDNRRAAVLRGSKAAVGALERYLNAAFVNEKTRWTKAPLAKLLTPRGRQALTPRARRALGENGPEVAGGRTRGATARVVVMHQHSTLVAATVRYTARLQIIRGDNKPEPVVQRGEMVFVPVRGGWRADMVDVELTLPGGKKG